MFISCRMAKGRVKCDDCGYMINLDEPLWYYGLQNGKICFRLCQECSEKIPNSMNNEYKDFKQREKKYYDTYML